jgi:hypothetical protein
VYDFVTIPELEFDEAMYEEGYEYTVEDFQYIKFTEKPSGPKHVFYAEVGLSVVPSISRFYLPALGESDV